MKAAQLKKAMQHFKQHRDVFLATASAGGLPHIATAGNIELVPPDSIAITEWFCPRTISNLNENPSLSLVLWDRSHDRGIQIIGTSRRLEDIAILNGYSAEAESRPAVPQVEWKLLMSVSKILDFTRAPHTDVACEE